MSTISKYFKVLNETVSAELKSNSDSPYKNVLHEIKGIDFNSSNESNDFRTPKTLPKTKPKVLPKKTNAKKPKARRNLSKTKTAPISVKANTAKIDYNLEHLHMAVALSKSLQNEDKDETDESLNGSGTNSHKVSLLDKLQQYKFQAGSSKIQPLNRRTFLEKKRTKSKHQYFQPILLLRTQVEREQIISNKVSSILSNNTNQRTIREVVEENPSSRYLQNCYSCEQKIFRKSKYSNENTLKDFYVDSLKIDPCFTKCGSLLKNWHEIPGRSLSPIPTVINTEMQHNIKAPHNSRCTSPDLFDSEDELLQQCSPIASKSPVLKCTLSEASQNSSRSELNVTSVKETLESSTSDEFFENDNGVCVFETFSCQNLCLDLSQPLSDYSDTKELNLESEQHQSLKTGVSETFEKIVSLVTNDDTIDYVYKLLDEEAEKKLKINNSKELVKFGDEHEELYSKEINLTCLNHELSLKQVETYDLTQNLDLDLKADDSTRAEINFCFKKTESFNSTNSEESICISDDEINYSCLHSTPTRARRRSLKKSGSFYSLSEDSDSSHSSGILNDEPNKEECLTTSPTSNSISYLSSTSNSKKAINEDDVYKNLEPVVLGNSNSNDLDITLLNNEVSNKLESSEIVSKNPSTPKTEITMKSSNVTPMPDYNEMNTPKLVKELEKFGLKPLKRQRGVQLLKHIYDSTHPLINNVEDNDRSKKKRKMNGNEKSDDFALISDNATPTSSNNVEGLLPCSLIKIGKNILGPNEELVFERKQSKKVLSCMVPLHIAWHNLVTSNPDMRKKILLYEPLQLEDLYQTLKTHGYKYHIQDLLTFLDRKCITIRTEQTSRSRHKRQKKSRTRQC